MKRIVSLLLTLLMIFSLAAFAAPEAGFQGIEFIYSTNTETNVITIDVRMHGQNAAYGAIRLQHDPEVVQWCTSEGEDTGRGKVQYTAGLLGSLDSENSTTENIDSNLGWATWSERTFENNVATVSTYVNPQMSDENKEFYGINSSNAFAQTPADGVDLFRIYYKPVEGKTLDDVTDTTFSLFENPEDKDAPKGVAILTAGKRVADGAWFTDFPEASTPTTPTVDNITLGLSANTVEVGSSVTATVNVTGTGEFDDTYTLSVDEESVGEVSIEGNTITGVSAGAVTIIATANGDSSKTATASLTVTDSTPAASVDSVSISLNPTTITVGGTSEATVTVSVTGEIDDSYTLSANPAGNVSIEGNTITGVIAGTVTITATSVADSEKSASATLTINAAAKPVTGVSIVDGDGADVTSIELVEGTSQQLSAKVEPADADDTSVTWTVTEGTDFVTVENGLVTAVKAGSATITLASVSNPSVTDTVTVTVTAKPYEGPTKAEIAVEENGVPVATNVIIGVAETTKQLTLIADKEAEVTWAITAGSEFATIDSETGLLTIKGTGLITVTATAVTTAADMTNGTVEASFNVYANGEEVVYLDTPVVGLANTVTDTTFNVTLKSTLTNAYPSQATIGYEETDLTVTNVAVTSGSADFATPGTIELVNLDAQSDVTISFQVANAAIAAGDSTALTLTGVVATVADTSETYTDAIHVENARVIFTAEAPITVEKLYEVKADAVKADGSPLYGLKINAEAGKDIKVTDNSGTPRQAYWVDEIQAYVVLSDVDYSTGDITGKIAVTDTESVPTVILGDVNSDGKVLAADALEVAKYMVGQNNAISDQAFIAANINGLYAQGSAMLKDDDADLYDIGRILYLATDVTVEP